MCPAQLFSNDLGGCHLVTGYQWGYFRNGAGIASEKKKKQYFPFPTEEILKMEKKIPFNKISQTSLFIECLMQTTLCLNTTQNKMYKSTESGNIWSKKVKHENLTKHLVLIFGQSLLEKV